MALSIKHPEADRLARELARATGETITDAVVTSLRERLERETRRMSPDAKLAQIDAIVKRVAAMPIIDPNFDEQSLYDAVGLPA